MKKWISLLLTLAMLGTLMVPAWAAEPEDVEIVEAVEDDYVETEYEKGWSEGWDAGYADSSAKALADFLAGVPFTGGETYEAGYQDGYDDGMQRGYSEAYAKYTEIADRGGVPGRVNVMWKGKCLAFPGVQPEIKDGRTMIPVRAVLEGMDAEVSYDHAKKSVSICLGDSVVTFVIGAKTTAVSIGGGEDKTIEMDCASYLKDGSTMVPLRFLSEACGYTVLWDQDYRTAVVVDANGEVGDLIIESGDGKKRISNFNALFHRILGEKQDKKIKQTGTITMDIQSWDNDAQTLVSNPITGTITSWSEGMKAYVEMTFDLSKWKADPDGLASLLPRASISTLTISMLLDEKGELYLTSPQLVPLITGGEENVWLSIDSISRYGIESMMDLDIGWLIIGSLLRDTSDAFHFYDRLSVARTQIVDLFGDDICTPNGEGYTWTTRSGNESGFKGTTTLMPDGTGSIDLQMAQLDEEDSGTITEVKANMTGTHSEGDVTVTTRLWGSDMSKVKVSVKADNEIVDTLPDFTLPEGATVVTLEELLYGEIPVEE